ncbi:hypothetical protein [Streptomyces sp. H39-S7]|uniref:hypothetical protein n=1 Tax=Streptomyces sp. H39-S7 TaxID=3004357 RepID=UPI0022AF07E2|nr:hypothetical protein [Streptomyces sp. H39-S7]MCZ4125710.1 hypothetical protein [Streptomyces sp. H39-S7]
MTQGREADSRGAWGSVLSAGGFAAVKGAGFEPVGQVLGTAVFNVGYGGGAGCPGAWADGGGTQVAFSPLVRSMYAARRLALGRAVAECRVLGGDGIVAVTLRVGGFPAGGLEFTALGTAVRGRSRVRPGQPFTSHLSGQDFAKLMDAGWVPTGLAFGISVAARHDDFRTRRARWTAGNQEVDGYTRLINHVRHDARTQLAREATTHGGDGLVVDDMELRVRASDCVSLGNTQDYTAEAVFVGTSIARFGRAKRPAGPRPLTIMRLERERWHD